MSTISNDKKTPAQQANDARPPFDGPHRAVKKKAGDGTTDASSDTTAPSYVVVVTKREKGSSEGADGGSKGASEDDPPRDVSHTYNPQELRAKARAFLKSGHINADEKAVLEEILGPDEAEDSGKAAAKAPGLHPNHKSKT